MIDLQDNFGKVTSYLLVVRITLITLRVEHVSRYVFTHSLAMQASLWIRASKYYHSQRNKQKINKYESYKEMKSTRGFMVTHFVQSWTRCFILLAKAKSRMVPSKVEKGCQAQRTNEQQSSGQAFRDFFFPIFPSLSTASLSKYISLLVINRL